MLPKIIDLFSGCGGLALGFEKAGFDILTGVEIDQEAVKTISYNLNWRYDKKETHICGDITKIDESILKEKIGTEGCIVIGGPPCQAYSRAGKGKLRSLGKERIHTKDKRGYLYEEFLKFVFALDARAVVMENVPEAVNFGGINIPQQVCEALEDKGYKCFWTILNAADFGVPQVRERVFVIGVKQSEKKEVALALPTHKNNDGLTTAYQKRFEKFSSYSNFRSPSSNQRAKKSWISVKEAIEDLPTLFPSEFSKYKLTPLKAEMEYKVDISNEYQELMRTWYGEEIKRITANTFRKNVRDFPIFARMEQGDNYIAASKIADQLLVSALKVYSYPVGSTEYEQLKKQIVPRYDRNKFEGKWKRLSENRPSHTLVAHLGKDTYSHIHPWEPRGISVREAARIQSFPDDFYFDCSMGDAFRQIGNAVPPILAYGVAKTLKEVFWEE